MSKKILVVYYSQTGQLLDIVNSVMSPIVQDENISVTYEVLKPKPPFPFPWKSDEFFQAMPECVKGIPCGLESFSPGVQQDFDLIVIAWQPWFLSPSIPISSFLQSNVAQKLLPGKPVITIIGSRNMWVMAQEKIRSYILAANGIPAGNIVLYDRASNLLSVVSVVRWMFTGKKDRFMKIFPPAGISESDIKDSCRFGSIIRESLNNNSLSTLRSKLTEAGAVNIQPSLVMIEKRGIIFFRIWADFIMKKGAYGDPARLVRVRLFKYYLLAVIYIISPFATALFYLTRPLRGKAIKKQISLYRSL